MLNASGRPVESQPPPPGTPQVSALVEAMADPSFSAGRRRPGTSSGQPFAGSSSDRGGPSGLAGGTSAQHGRSSMAHASGAGPAQRLTPAQKTVREAEALVKKLQWRGGSTYDPDHNWWEFETLESGYVNDYARWLQGGGLQPKDDGVMNCWQALLFCAYRAGEIGFERLREIHRKAAAAASEAAAGNRRANFFRSRESRRVHAILAGEKAFYAQLKKEMTKGGLSRYTNDPPHGIGNTVIPEGKLIIFDDFGHVALSLGRRDPQLRQLVLSHLSYPGSNLDLFPRPGKKYPDRYGFMQVTTVEELVRNLGFRKVEFGDAWWA
jgi:hypothetical protein